ncbi:MAG TPA: tetratricopeptide repeat protein, partial [Gemmataceae bacterium]|nr:tetratricopeptide repeat protein [Gemmataceae bacterium]
WPEAEQCYRQAVQAYPNDAEAWRALAGVCLAQRRPADAVPCLQQVVRLQPQRAEAHLALGLALKELGHSEQARASLQQALRLRPGLPEALAALGHLLAGQDRLAEAVACYEQALQERPQDAETRTNLGIALARLGHLPNAVVAFRQTLETNPELARAHQNLGVALSQQGKPEEGMASLREAIRLRPDYAEAHYNLGNLLNEERRYDQAVTSYREALAARPDYADACNNLGVALNHLGRSGEAVVILQHAVRLRPDFAESHNNLGLAFADLGRFAEAEAAYLQTLRLNPRHADAHANLACVYQWQGRLAEAETAFQLAVWLAPDAAGLHWNRSLFWLQKGDFERGWPEYEWRWKKPTAPVYGRRPRTFAQPRWDGGPLEGKRVLLYMEQGLGDMLQFIRYARLLHERGGRVLVECPAFLAPLLATCPGVDQTVAEGATLPDFDVQAPLLSLPGLCGTTLETVPAEVPYLFPPEERVMHWRERIAEYVSKNGDRHLETRSQSPFLVGIVWQGNPHHRWDHHRSVPLEQFAPLARMPGVRLFSVQHGQGTEQLKHTRLPIVSLEVGDFQETACIVKNLDLVVTVDTATAHLAGALGVPTWILLSVISDWRWLFERTDSPWYPTVRLFRQKRVDDWMPVFRRVAKALRRLAKMHIANHEKHESHEKRQDLQRAS